MPSSDISQYLTQSGKTLQFFCPLDDDILLLQRFTGTERISGLYQFSLTLLAVDYTKVDFAKLLGKQASISLSLPDGTARWFDGIITRFAQSNPVVDDNGVIAFYRYQAELVPKVWLLTKTSRCRIYQHMSVPDILAKVFTGYSVSTDYMSPEIYKPRDYCVQYRESDFAFASRLMEEEGIYFYFTHAEKSHEMHLVDSTMKLSEIPGDSSVGFRTVYADVKEDELIVQWEKVQEIRPGKYTLRDWNFALDSNLEATSEMPANLTVGKVSHSLQIENNSSLEIYDYPGEYGERFDESIRNDCFNESVRMTRIRMERETLPALTTRGAGNCRRFASGAEFSLTDHFDGEGAYILTRVDHIASVADAYTGGDPDSIEYANSFECVPKTAVYRPARITPKPRIQGTQTAKVVSIKNEGEDDIFTDEFARVQVRFFWDRDATSDESTSCWIRVGTPWAGTAWGGIHIPRVGQEVIVAFVEGDPDRPIIIGSVYNECHRPPYTLPDDKTQSGVKSRSSISGDDTQFNELRFEDLKGSEQVYFHAEKDFERVVENNDTLTVGVDGSKSLQDGNQTITIYKDRTGTIKTGNETLTVEKGNRTITVKEGDDKHEVSVGKRDVIVNADDTHQIKTGNRTATIDQGNDKLTISMGNQDVEISLGNQTTKLAAGSSTTEAMQGITLKVAENSIEITPMGITLKSGPSSIQLTPMGVTVKGMMVNVEGEMMLTLKADLMTQVNGEAMLMLKGGITMIN